MQWGIGHGALRPFTWSFRILSHYSAICLKFKRVNTQAFFQSLHLQQHLIKQSFWYFALLFSCWEFKLIWKGGSVKRALDACCKRSRYVPSGEKGRDLTQSYDKSPYTNRNVKRAVTTQTTPQKSSIKQRLRTDLGRSVGVTTATQLVWLTGLRAHLHTNRNSRLIKRTHV